MTSETDPDEVVLVWKLPKEKLQDVGDFHKRGIYPSGELMAICENEDDANELVEKLQNSSSGRFDNNNLPYKFAVSNKDIYNPGNSLE